MTYLTLVFQRLKRRCHGNELLGLNWQHYYTLPSFSALAFRNGLEDRNADRCAQYIDDNPSALQELFRKSNIKLGDQVRGGQGFEICAWCTVLSSSFTVYMEQTRKAIIPFDFRLIFVTYTL